MSQIWGNLGALTWQMAAMWIIGGVMIYLAICKEMEPTLDVYKRQVHNSLKKRGHAKAQPRFRPSFLEQTHFFAFSGC